VPSPGCSRHGLVRSGGGAGRAFGRRQDRYGRSRRRPARRCLRRPTWPVPCLLW